MHKFEQTVDNPGKKPYTKYRKGATGKTVSPQGLIQKEVTAWIRALAVTSFYKPERTGYKYQ